MSELAEDAQLRAQMDEACEGHWDAVKDRAHWLVPNPRLPTDMYLIAHGFYTLALNVLRATPSCPQLVEGLQALLVAKDACVRAAGTPKPGEGK